MNLNLYFRVNFFLRNISGMIKIVYNPLLKNAKIKNTTRVLIFDKSCWYWIFPLIVLWFCIIQGKRKCVQEQALEVVKDFVVLSHEIMLSLQDKEYPLSIFLSLPQYLHVSKSVFEIKGLSAVVIVKFISSFLLRFKSYYRTLYSYQKRGTWDNITYKQNL